ncbi:MAG TPA: sialate O-acetylesterase [Terracidiphilus sp.]|nr:sialate O-acetylesterase [Terracidiphilus sp.]
MRGKIQIDGQLHVAADQLEARLTGNSLSGSLAGNWVRLPFSKSTGKFHLSLATTSGGFYQLQVRALRRGKEIAETTVPHVGLGEVFVVSGQSNATNYGEVRQVSETRMVAAFDGKSWRIADDPQPGVQDHSHKGSFIPAFGDARYRKYHVPIGIADVGHGSTSVRQWLPAGYLIYVVPTMAKFVKDNPQGQLVSDGTLFDGMMLRIHQLGKRGFRALLWHQGESDSQQPPGHNISAAMYRKMMVELIKASRKDAGWKFPWIVAEATYQPKSGSTPAIEAAQRSLWHKGLAYEGPDTDALGPAWRQDQGKGVHFNAEGLKKHGQMWAQAVEAYLAKALG